MMRHILYTAAAGSLCVVTPVEGARFAFAIKAADGSDVVRSKVAVPIDSLLRGWPIAGLTAEWAETEDAFVERIRVKDVPVDAVESLIVDESVIPASRAYRAAWRLNNGVLELDQVKVALIDAATTR